MITYLASFLARGYNSSPENRTATETFQERVLFLDRYTQSFPKAGKSSFNPVTNKINFLIVSISNKSG